MESDKMKMCVAILKKVFIVLFLIICCQAFPERGKWSLVPVTKVSSLDLAVSGYMEPD